MTHNITTARLWIGTTHDTEHAVIQYIHRTVAPCRGCKTCYFCTLLHREISYQLLSAPPLVLWLRPRENGYVRGQIDEALAVLDVALDAHEQSAVVIESIDLLNHATANRLLKIVEEPPPGWHLLFTTDRLSDVLPTLQSRCLIQSTHPRAHEESEPLFSESSPLVRTWLEDPKPHQWIEVCGQIDQLPPTAPEANRELSRLIALWHAKWREGNDPRASTMLALLTSLTTQIPTSGGTTGFWRVALLRVFREVL